MKVNSTNAKDYKISKTDLFTINLRELVIKEYIDHQNVEHIIEALITTLKRMAIIFSSDQSLEFFVMTMCQIRAELMAYTIVASKDWNAEKKIIMGRFNKVKAEIKKKSKKRTKRWASNV